MIFHFFRLFLFLPRWWNSREPYGTFFFLHLSKFLFRADDTWIYGYKRLEVMADANSVENAYPP